MRIRHPRATLPSRTSSGPPPDVSDAECFCRIFFSSRFVFSSSNRALVCLRGKGSQQRSWISGKRSHPKRRQGHHPKSQAATLPTVSDMSDASVAHALTIAVCTGTSGARACARSRVRVSVCGADCGQFRPMPACLCTNMLPWIVSNQAQVRRRVRDAG